MPRRLSFAFACLFAAHATSQSVWSPTHDRRAAGPAVFDGERGRPVLFDVVAGLDAAQVWEWRGNAWAVRPEVLPALPGTLVAATWDPGRSEVLLLCDTAAGQRIALWNGQRLLVPTQLVGPPSALGSGFTFDLARGRAVRFGGYTGSATFPTTQGGTWEWDGLGWTQFPGPEPVGRAWPVLVHDPVRGASVLFGGRANNGVLGTLGDTWIWNGVVWAAVATPTQPNGRWRAAATFDPHSQRVVMTRGVGGELQRLWYFTGSDWVSWSSSSLPVQTTSLVPDAQGLLAIEGAQTHRVVGSTCVLVHTTGNAASSLHNEVLFDGLRGRVTLFGRESLRSWDGSAWTLHSSSPAPATRGGHGFAFDAVRGEVVVFGGYALSLLQDTWVWGGSAWTQRLPSVRPPARLWARMVHDPLRAVVVLFGGNDLATNLADTWLWSGTQWSQAAPATVPPARAGHGMAFDSARGVVVMHGGDVVTRDDTWEWDGVDWSLRSLGGSAHAMAALAFDPSRNAVVALHDDGVANQGWSWSGQAWTSLAMGTPVRGGQHLVTDTWRRRLHAVGAAGTLVASQGMWVLGPTPAAVTHHGSGCGAPEPMVTASGKPTPGNAGFELAVSARAAQAPVFLLLGGAAVQQPLGGGCDLQVGVHFATLLAPAGATGFAAFALAIPADPILLGFAVETQAATIGANGPAWSSRLQVRIGD